MPSRRLRIAVSVVGAALIVAIAILLAGAVGGERDTAGRPLDPAQSGAPATQE